MKKISLSALGADFAERLREARNESEELTVVDGRKPVARIVPYDSSGPALRVREPAPDAPALCDVPLPPPLEIEGDIVDLLLEERQNER